MKSIFVFTKPYETTTIIAKDEEEAKEFINPGLTIDRVIEDCVTDETESQIVSWHME